MLKYVGHVWKCVSGIDLASNFLVPGGSLPRILAFPSWDQSAWTADFGPKDASAGRRAGQGTHTAQNGPMVAGGMMLREGNHQTGRAEAAGVSCALGPSSCWFMLDVAQFSLQASYFRRRCFSFHGLWTDREVFQRWKMAESCAAAVCWVDGVNLILSSSSAGTHHERQGKGTLRQAHRRCWWKQGWRHLSCGWKLPEI